MYTSRSNSLFTMGSQVSRFPHPKPTVALALSEKALDRVGKAVGPLEVSDLSSLGHLDQ